MYKRLGLLVMFILIFIPISTINAHSPIESRSPNINVVLETVPSQVDLYFKDPVQIHRSSVIVRNGKNHKVHLGKPQMDPLDNRHIYVKLQEELPSDTYTVEIDVVSMDGHSLKETYSFEIKLAMTTPDKMFERLELVRTIPADGTIVEASPDQIDLWFNEPAELRFFGVLNDKQQIVPTQKPHVDPANPKHYILKLDQELPTGTYSIQAYPRIGDNTGIHIVYFAVKEFTSITSENGLSFVNDWKQTGVFQLVHWLSYFSLLSLVGGTFFQHYISKHNGNNQRWRTISYVLFGLSGLAFALEFFIYKSQHSSVVLIDFIRFNTVWISFIQISIIAISFFVQKIRFILLLIALLGFALTGHSADPSIGGLWVTVLDYIHLLTTSIWLGGIVALLAMTPKERPVNWLKKTGKTFSKWALLCFVGTGVTGILMSLSYVPSFSTVSLIESKWGQMLSLKTVLFLILILIGIWQRKRLANITGKLVAGFHKNLRIELVFALLIVLSTGILVDLSPEEAIQDISPIVQKVAGVTAEVNAYPLKPGGNDIAIQLSGYKDIPDMNVNLVTSLGGTGANRAFHLGEGLYKITGNLFHTAGVYNLEIELIGKNGETIQYPPFIIQVPGPMPNEVVIEKEG